jgi:ribA/ribD-fused uncharacterized protein
MILFYSSKTNPQYVCLSNYYHKSPFDLDGKHWKTVEHYYQAHKSNDINIRESMRNLERPGDAAYVGRRLPEIREDWEEVKYSIMYKAVSAKFNQNENVKNILINTYDEVLHEDSPTDFIWGWQNNGKDWLGKILMIVREEIVENLKKEIK